MGARVFLLADSGPPEQGETLVVSTALGASTTALQSMLAEETCAHLPVSLRAEETCAHLPVSLRMEETMRPPAGRATRRGPDPTFSGLHPAYANKLPSPPQKLWCYRPDFSKPLA